MGLKVYLTRNMCLLAESRLLAERWTEGLEGITEALAIASQTKEQWYVAPLHQLRAEILLRVHGPIARAPSTASREGLGTPRRDEHGAPLARPGQAG